LTTCLYRGSDLRGDFWGNQQSRDPYYRPDPTFLRNEQDKARKRREEEKKKSFKPRMIVHPNFQNVALDDAVKVVPDYHFQFGLWVSCGPKGSLVQDRCNIYI
jgi:hypothetical protein